MAIISSNAAVMTIDGSAPTCPISSSLKTSLALKDTQCSASNGWTQNAAGNLSWEMSMTFILTTDGDLTYGDLLAAQIARTTIGCSMAITGSITATGNAYITDITDNNPANADPIEISVTLTGDGVLTVA